jgi:hypothetical protein
MEIWNHLLHQLITMMSFGASWYQKILYRYETLPFPGTLWALLPPFPGRNNQSFEMESDFPKMKEMVGRRSEMRTERAQFHSAIFLLCSQPSSRPFMSMVLLPVPGLLCRLVLSYLSTWNGLVALASKPCHYGCPIIRLGTSPTDNLSKPKVYLCLL